MQITVAGEKTEVKEGLTVGELLEIKQVETPEYVTVSLNDDFLEREKRDAVVLKEGDVVEFIYFMGGGACL
ncbi:sulfur carrier protein [Ruminobacter amylophilus]|uniref:Sulfur carrier protein n=2 Tax=Succinivibrionaceae TaxID=83763 RepID=A0A662ZJP4_9GAMM|nr:sulfur carrier protein [Ruminobacter amylophilus]